MAYMEQVRSWRESLPHRQSVICIVGDRDDNATPFPSYSVFVEPSSELLRRIIEDYFGVLEPSRAMRVASGQGEPCEHTVRAKGAKLIFDGKP